VVDASALSITTTGIGEVTWVSATVPLTGQMAGTIGSN